MTVIAAYTDGVDTWIGSDTASACSSGLMFECGEKWFGAHGWMFGHAGDSRVADIIKFNADELFRTMCVEEFPERYSLLLDRCGLKPHFAIGEVVPNWQQGGILVRRGEVWDVDGPLALTPIKNGKVFARGSGGHDAISAAWGYAAACLDLGMSTSPSKLIEIAVECAGNMDRRIRGLWTMKL